MFHLLIGGIVGSALAVVAVFGGVAAVQGTPHGVSQTHIYDYASR